jgi:hypothetical protein
MRAGQNFNSGAKRIVRGSDLVPGQTVRMVFSGERFRTVRHERLLKLIALDREDKTPRFLFRFGVNPTFEIIEENEKAENG